MVQLQIVSRVSDSAMRIRMQVWSRAEGNHLSRHIPIHNGGDLADWAQERSSGPEPAVAEPSCEAFTPHHDPHPAQHTVQSRDIADT